MLGILALVPLVTFALGTWQVKRLKWKQDLIASADNKIILPPLPLPNYLNPSAVEDFDFRRVRATGVFDHEHEMLVGPRTHEGKNGYFVITPLKRKNGSTLLIDRGWISSEHKDQSSRPESLTRGEVTIDCILRKKPLPNRFTPESDPEANKYYFIDVDTMAKAAGAQPIYIQELRGHDLVLFPEQMILLGIPLGYPPKLEIRNTHFQYIITWYGLCAISTGMLIMMLCKSKTQRISDPLKRRVAHERKWQ